MNFIQKYFSTYLTRPASSWLDDYIDWLAIDECCKMNTTDGSFCPSSKFSIRLVFVWDEFVIVKLFDMQIRKPKNANVV